MRAAGDRAVGAAELLPPTLLSLKDLYDYTNPKPVVICPEGKEGEKKKMSAQYHRNPRNEQPSSRTRRCCLAARGTDHDKVDDGGAYKLGALVLPFGSCAFFRLSGRRSFSGGGSCPHAGFRPRSSTIARTKGAATNVCSGMLPPKKIRPLKTKSKHLSAAACRRRHHRP